VQTYPFHEISQAEFITLQFSNAQNAAKTVQDGAPNHFSYRVKKREARAFSGYCALFLGHQHKPLSKGDTLHREQKISF